MDHVIEIAELIISMLLAKAPRDTWNMINTIGYIVYDDNNVDVLIGGEFAPYAPYTNERWLPPVDLERYPSGKKRSKRAAQRLKSYSYGGQNPNEGWFDLVLEQAMMLQAEINQGVMISNV